MESQNRIKSSEHVFVCGMTGTGKSFLCEHYTPGYLNVVKLDTKGEIFERRAEGKTAWYGLEEGTDFEVCFHLEELQECELPKIIYAPTFDEQNKETYNLFFQWIFERGNTVLWIDELMSIGTVNSYPERLKQLMTMGRSKNVGVWCCTQRPSEIPSITLANSKHFFVYTLMLPQDRKKMSDTTGMPEMLKPPGGFRFWYYRMGDKNCTLGILKEGG